jgi:hypothetical protein
MTILGAHAGVGEMPELMSEPVCGIKIGLRDAVPSAVSAGHRLLVPCCLMTT